MSATSKSSANNLISEFLQSIRLSRGASDHTVDAYRRDLEQFMGWLGPHRELSQLISDDLLHFLAHLQSLKPASIARKVSTLRQFFKFCSQEKEFSDQILASLVSPKPSEKLPRFLSEQDILQLLTTAQTGLPYPSALSKALQARDCSMIYLLYATGLRASELIHLTLHQLDLAEGYLRVLGKGGKERITPFASSAGQKLQIYLEEFRPSLDPQGDHLYLNHRGQGLTRQALWKILKTLAAHAGISPDTSPHILRHSFATHLLQSGMNLRSLQILMGHSDLGTTQIYTHITPEHLKKAHQRFHPRG